MIVMLSLAWSGTRRPPCERRAAPSLPEAKRLPAALRPAEHIRIPGGDGAPSGATWRAERGQPKSERIKVMSTENAMAAKTPIAIRT